MRTNKQLLNDAILKAMGSASTRRERASRARYLASERAGMTPQRLHESARTWSRAKIEHLSRIHETFKELLSIYAEEQACFDALRALQAKSRPRRSSRRRK